MAKALLEAPNKANEVKISRPNRHSKKKSSSLKTSKNYVKRYNSQGR